MRQSTKTTGVWSTSFDGDGGDWPPEEDFQYVTQSQQQGSWVKADESSPRGKSAGTQRDGNPSTELARSLTFPSEALSQLQKSWAYTYTAASHNTVYKEALELSQMKRTRMHLRRALSASMSSFKHQSPDRDIGKDGRPFTARSTPCAPRRSHRDSPSDRRAASASANKNRPKTSVGVVRVTQKQKKIAEGWHDKGDRASLDDSQCAKGVKKHDVDVSEIVSTPAHALSSGQRTNDSVTTAIFEITGTQGTAIVLSPSEKNVEGSDKLPLLVKKTNGVIRDSRVTPSEAVNVVCLLKSGTEQNKQADVQQISSHERDYNTNSVDAAHDHGETRSVQPSLSNESTKQRGNAKRVQIKLGQEQSSFNTEPPVSSEQMGIPAPVTQCSQSTVPAKDGTVASAGDDTVDGDAVPTAAAVSTLDKSEQLSHNRDEGYKRPKSVSYAATVINDSGPEFRPKSQGPGQRSQPIQEPGKMERRGSASPVKGHPTNLGQRRGSFMKIVDQLEALKNNGRRSLRAGDKTEVESPKNEVAGSVGEAPDQQINGDTSNTKDVQATEKNTTNSTTQTQSKTSPTAEQPENTSRVSKPLPSVLEISPAPEAPHLSEEKASEMVSSNLAAESTHHQPNHHPDLDENNHVVDFLTSEQDSYTGSDYTVFNGYKIRNYVRPQLRYRADPFLSSRRERSLIRLSIEHPVYLNGNRGDMKSDMLFPKTCRQKVLQELVDRNNQPAPVQDSGVVPPELRAKIDEFFKTIEPYCPKPEVLPNQ